MYFESHCVEFVLHNATISCRCMYYCDSKEMESIVGSSQNMMPTHKSLPSEHYPSRYWKEGGSTGKMDSWAWWGRGMVD